MSPVATISRERPDGSGGARRRAPSARPGALLRLEAHHRLFALAMGLLGMALMVGLWALLLAVGILPSSDIPSPSAVADALGELVKTSKFWSALGETVRAAFLGLAIAFAVTLPLSIAIGFLWPVRAALNPPVQFLRIVPGVALIPVGVLLFGPTATLDVAMVAWGSAWPLLVQLTNGMRGAPKTALMTARAFGLSPAARIRWVVVPSAMPFVATGLRIGVSYALIIAISVELIAGSPGLGSSIRDAQTALNVGTMYALILATGIVGVALHSLLAAAEHHYLRWQPTREGGRR